MIHKTSILVISFINKKIDRGIDNQSFRDWNSSIYRFHHKTKENRIKEELKNRVFMLHKKQMELEQVCL